MNLEGGGALWIVCGSRLTKPVVALGGEHDTINAKFR